MKEELLYTISWHLKKDKEKREFVSPNKFTKKEARRLVHIANKHFERAIHRITKS